MKVYSTLQIGEYHLDHCEDYLFFGEIGDSKIVCATMDGCSMGTDSYFIATLVGKLLRKIVKEKLYKQHLQLETFVDSESCLKSILKDLFSELNKVKGQLMLQKYELLTTLILLVADLDQQRGTVIVLGDGLVCINGEITKFEQDNQPDYLGYHLGEAFENWYQTQQQKLSFSSMQDISISTDGILSFAKVKKMETSGIINPVEFLLTDKQYVESEDMLNLKVKQLEHQFGLRPTDDLGIIRLIK